jgi:hypothetical protein
MARGWASKSIEEQQSEMADNQKSGGPRRTAAEQKHNREREGLQLARKSLVQQLETASHPGHRQILEQSIAGIDKQLAFFEKVTPPPAPK